MTIWQLESDNDDRRRSVENPPCSSQYVKELVKQRSNKIVLRDTQDNRKFISGGIHKFLTAMNAQNQLCLKIQSDVVEGSTILSVKLGS